MRRKKLMMIMVIVMVIAAALVITACGASEASEAGKGDTDAGSSMQNEDPGEEDNDEGKNEEKPADDNPADSPLTENPSDFEPSDAEDPEAPIGSDRSVRGIPVAKSVRKADDGDLLVLVNKYYTVSRDYEPSDMVTIDNRYGTYTDMQMKAVAYEAYKKLYNDAAALGYELKLCSTMRSYGTQKMLYTNYVNGYGQQEAYLSSAYPGRSEHHTGLALDITSKSMGWGLKQDFADFEDGKWINEHCHEYGFIIRYPKGKTDITGYKYEPWHLRYVGKDVAEEIMSRGITLEEYLGKVPEEE